MRDWTSRRFWGLAALILLSAATPLWAPPIIYVTRDFVNRFSALQKFDAGIEYDTATSAAADDGPQFQHTIDFDNSYTPSGTTVLGRMTVSGHLANATDAISIGSTSGGSLPADTYHVKYSWIGRYGNGSNGSSAGATVGRVITVPGGQGDFVLAGPNATLVLTLPVEYPAGAIGWMAFCNRDGDAIPEFRACMLNPINNPTTTANITTTAIWTANSLVTTNNTRDMQVFAAAGNGFIEFNSDDGIMNPFGLRMGFTSASNTFKLGPSFDYTHDGGTTVYRLREPRYFIPVCGGTGIDPSDAIAAIAAGDIPTPSTTAGVTLVANGHCTGDSSTWIDDLSIVSQQVFESAGGLSVDLTNVDRANFIGLQFGVQFTGSGATSIRIADSTVTHIDLHDSTDILVERSRLGCGFWVVEGGSYTFRGNDFTCPPSGSTGVVTRALILGDCINSGVATSAMNVVISDNVMRPTSRTTDNYATWVQGCFDATATSSTVLIANNAIHLDNGDDTACLRDDSLSDGSLVHFSSGQSFSSANVRVRATGNSLWQRSCSKGIDYRVFDLDESLGEWVSTGDNLYAETTGTGTAAVDEDTHCYEGALGTGRTISFNGGTCITVNNANGGARPFYIHGGCCAAAANPQIYIEDYYIEARSTASPATLIGFGVGQQCDANNGCDVWLRDVTIRKSFSDLTLWNDLYDNSGLTTSSIVVRNVDYDSADISGPIRVQSGMVPIATAPSYCEVGDTYTDTSGADCTCTVAGRPGTWTNSSGTGTCV